MSARVCLLVKASASSKVALIYLYRSSESLVSASWDTTPAELNSSQEGQNAVIILGVQVPENMMLRKAGDREIRPHALLGLAMVRESSPRWVD